MGDAGFRGVSAAQDGRFRNKEQALLKKLAASGQFPAHFAKRVDMSRVNRDVMRPWIADRVEELLGFEDDVVVEYVNGLLDGDKEGGSDKQLDPRKMQLSLTGFLETSTPTFMSELWTLLLSAQESIGGIPREFVERKKEEMRLARERDAAAIASSRIASTIDKRPSRGGARQYDDRRREPRQAPGSFLSKSGTRTERVQDSGWGARSRQVSPPPRDRDRDRAWRDDGADRRRRDDSPGRRRRDGSPERRRRDDSPDRRRRDDSPPEARRAYRHRPREGSYSPPPPRRRRSPSRSPPRRSREQRSITPQWKQGRPRHSPSITPPRRSRSPTYTPPPAAARRGHAERSPSPPPASRRDVPAEGARKRSRWDT